MQMYTGAQAPAGKPGACPSNARDCDYSDRLLVAAGIAGKIIDSAFGEVLSWRISNHPKISNIRRGYR